MMRYQLIDILRGTQISKKYKEFSRTSYTPNSLKKQQLNKLASLLLFLRHSNLYYKELLFKFSLSEIRNNPQKVVSALPIADKPFIIKNMNALFQAAPNRKYQAKHTGGSTGTPLRYYVDLDAISASWAYILWSWHKYANYSPGIPFTTIAGSSLGSLRNKIQIKIYHALQNNYFIPGDLISPNMNFRPKRIKKAKILYGYPSAILAFIDVKSKAFDRHNLRAVFTTSEQLLPNVRKTIEAHLRVPVYDIYGANDGGLISCECSMHNGFHYDPLNCYIEEFKNEDGETELLLTSLNSLCLPFIRYRVGDVANLEDFGVCKCGDPYPMIRNLSGRTRDLIILNNGNKVHGSKFNKIFSHYPEIRRYRILQTENYDIHFKLDVNNFGSWMESNQRKALVADIEEIIGDKAEFNLEELTIKNFSLNKFKLIESHVH